MPVRLFTVEEANALLQSLNDLLAKAQEVMARLRNVRDQLVDLRIIWGEKILDASCPDASEYESYRDAFQRCEAELAAITDRVSALGCEPKDLELGLVDFAAARGEEIVYLCWKRGEARVAWWHPTSEGYAARQPIQTF